MQDIRSYQYSLKKLSRWRFLAIFFFISSIFLLYSKGQFNIMQSKYVAQIWIEGIIDDNNRYRENQLYKILDDPKAMGLIVNINSPGGTFVGGEKLYNIIKEIAAKKPTIVVMGSQATSAAYMAALGANKIIASQGTITGSVGVILQSFEATDLAKKIGINPVIIKSSPFKSVPNPAEKIGIEDQKYLQDIVSKSKDVFISIILQNRGDITAKQLGEISTGKIFLGDKAKELNLIDDIGGSKMAKKWLNSMGVDTINIRDITLNKAPNNIKNLLKGFNPSSMMRLYSINNMAL